MAQITRLFVKVREAQPGRTMAEYAVILAFFAVLVSIGYRYQP